MYQTLLTPSRPYMTLRDRKHIARWYSYGIINRRTFIYLWGRGSYFPARGLS